VRLGLYAYEADLFERPRLKLTMVKRRSHCLQPRGRIHQHRYCCLTDCRIAESRWMYCKDREEATGSVVRHEQTRTADSTCISSRIEWIDTSRSCRQNTDHVLMMMSPSPAGTETRFWWTSQKSRHQSVRVTTRPSFTTATVRMMRMKSIRRKEAVMRTCASSAR